MPGPNDDKPYCGICPHKHCVRSNELRNDENDCTIFTCSGCGQEMPSCFGCDDGNVDLCDMCAHAKEHGDATGVDDHGNATFDDGSTLWQVIPKNKFSFPSIRTKGAPA